MNNYKIWSDRGRMDCALDRNENTPFASTGGLDERCNMQVPQWIADATCMQKLAYMEGYCTQAFEMYGHDWMTCPFGWRPALKIEAKND